MISRVTLVTKAMGLMLGIIRSKRNKTNILTNLAQSHKDNPYPYDIWLGVLNK